MGMDSAAVGAVLTAVAAGGGDAVAAKAWEGLGALVRRPPRRAQPAAGTPSSGEAELAALAAEPGDERCAVALAGVLVARADGDSEFAAALTAWWEQARHAAGGVTNTISGGRQYGPVLQGRDFTNLTFGPAVAPPAPPPPDPSAE
jgi:hypothetical protein